MKDQELLDLASKASGRTIDDHMEAINILLEISREMDALKKTLGVANTSEVPDKLKEMIQRKEDLQKQLDSLKSDTKNI